MDCFLPVREEKLSIRLLLQIAKKIWIEENVKCFADDEVDDSAIEKSYVTARPRRLSEVNIVKKTRPIPKGNAFFIFSHKNRYVSLNETWLRKIKPRLQS